MNVRASFAIALLVAASVAGVSPAEAQRGGQAAPPQLLTYDQARTAMDAAEAEARRNGWNLTIVIADAQGVPIYLRRMPNATARSYDIAMAKVRTVLGARMHTGDYAKALAEGRVDTVQNGVTFEGGYLVRINGEIAGAMTASGARGSEDAQVVRAGLAAIGIQP